MTTGGPDIGSAPGGQAWRVVVIDDTQVTREMQRYALESQGFAVFEAASAEQGLKVVAQSDPHVILLDVQLPDRLGIEMLDELKAICDAPVLLVTSERAEADRVHGLDLGADDYITKPFSVPELAARVRAAIRRAHPRPSAQPLVYGDLVIDPTARTVTVGGNRVELTAREFDVLHTLAATPDKVFSRSELLRSVWGSREDWQDPATVTEHIRRVRYKIESDPTRPRWLLTVRGSGYRFDRSGVGDPASHD